VKGKIERVRPEDIKTTGLLTIEGELDDISGSGQTAAAHDLCSGIPKTHQMHYEAKGAGHYGIFSGRRWRDMVYPVVKTFILSHQPKPAQATAAVASTTPAVVAKPAVRAAKPTQARTTTPVVNKVAVPVAKASTVKAMAKAPVAAKRKTPPRAA
jgi:poly(3-hydroxybutyrate) depolymerase